MSFPIIHYTRPAPHGRGFPFQQPIRKNIHDRHVLLKPVKTDSPEPESPVSAQNRCVARRLGRNLPSSFLALLSFPPCRPPSGWGGRAALGEPALSGGFPLPGKTGSRSRRQAFDNCREQRACQLVRFTSLTGNQKAKDTVVSSLVLWVSARPPRPAAHQRPGIRSVGNLN